MITLVTILLRIRNKANDNNHSDFDDAGLQKSPETPVTC